MTFPDLLKKKRGQFVEYLPEADADRLAETLVAFANGDGGTALVGLTPEGTMNESFSAEDAESLLWQAQSRCRPPVRTEWQQIEISQGTAVAIRVVRSTELHTLDDGRVLIRVGAENRPLVGDEVSHLAATKATGDFETEVVAGAVRSDLDDEIIQEYVVKREERGRLVLSRPLDEVLTEIGASTDSGEPTVTGLLLFGREPQFYLPQSSLVFVRFAGTEPRGPEGYPPFAVREALVNAVCHRDYRLKGRRIEVRMFDDRLEVISPGGLPGYITIDNIVDEHFSRNPRIVGGLYQWGYIEELGLGIDRMIEDMVQAGHPPPEFRATPYSFTVALRNVRERRAVPAAWERSMNERQLKALNYVREQGSITNREYQALCPTVSSETLRLDLKDLVERDILLRIGAKRGTYYILK
jgi:ATP-dependent DNA helicase RecG